MEDSKQDKSAKVSILRRPIVWVYLSVIYIWVLAISVLIATLGPPYVLSLVTHPKNSSSFSYFIESFPLYVQEATKELNISANIFMYSFFSNIIIFPIAILVGFFVLKKKLWARNSMIFIILLLILQPIIVGVITGGSFINFLDFETITEPIFFLIIIYILTRKSVKEIFIRKSNA